jgi:hypothetical protein
MQPLAMAEMPLEVPARASRFGSPLVLSRVHWVRPELFAQVKYLTWTADNRLRQVVYQGVHEDKPAAEVRRAAASQGGVRRQSRCGLEKTKDIAQLNATAHPSHQGSERAEEWKLAQCFSQFAKGVDSEIIPSERYAGGQHVIPVKFTHLGIEKPPALRGRGSGQLARRHQQAVVPAWPGLHCLQRAQFTPDDFFDLLLPTCGSTSRMHSCELWNNVHPPHLTAASCFGIRNSSVRSERIFGSFSRTYVL